MRRRSDEEEETSTSPTSTSTSGSGSDKPDGTSTDSTESTESIFSEVSKEITQYNKHYRWRGPKEHRFKTAKHKISPRKLNDLGKQIAGLPIDEAILQMQFSEKGASKWIKSTLALARDHAEMKGLRRSRLQVEAAWVNKSRYGQKLLDIKGRGRQGIKRHPYARLCLLLKEGKTRVERAETRFVKDLGKVRSAGLAREDGKLRRQHTKQWAW
ncbi:ribosomal protein L22/L17 [Naematelia encephala]|uniref:Ribosomal protein L22/L17 n=1 Tax=Naematelia encephala TaxID=71784 RepID=A0A1Y2BKT1_9TREE|nr:ribosomal protein L22/L17 [Naematelia encephala]